MGREARGFFAGSGGGGFVVDVLDRVATAQPSSAAAAVAARPRALALHAVRARFSRALSRGGLVGLGLTPAEDAVRAEAISTPQPGQQPTFFKRVAFFYFYFLFAGRARLEILRASFAHETNILKSPGK